VAFFEAVTLEVRIEALAELGLLVFEKHAVLLDLAVGQGFVSVAVFVVIALVDELDEPELAVIALPVIRAPVDARLVVILAERP